MQEILSRLQRRNINPTLFIDAGAHTGETYDAIKQIYTDAAVICFEANPQCEVALKGRTAYEICLLGDTEKPLVPFYIDPSNVASTGCSIYRELSKNFNENTAIYLNMHRLDSRVKVKDDVIPSIFLKLDVQGAEIDVLNGASGIMKWVDWIYLEVSFIDCNKGAPLFADIFNYLTEKKYRVTDFGDHTYIDNVLVQSNFLFEKAK